MNKTLIIAHRRHGQDYWEGYTERPQADEEEWVAYFKSLGQIVRTFPNMYSYRIDCEKLLDKWEARQRERNAASSR